jgi:hypothetical protein
VQARESEKTDSGLSIQTLVIASAASVTAAIFVHEVWNGGAIFGAAITPVIVAIVSESLKKPTKKLTAVREVRRPRAGEPGVARTERVATRAERVGARTGRPDPRPERGVPATRVAERPREDRFGIWEAERPPLRERLNGRHLRIALITGVLAFAIGAVVLTGTELLAGGSVGGGDRPTLVGGGKDRQASGDEQTSPSEPDTSQDGEAQQEPVPDQAPSEEAPQSGRPAPAPEEQDEPAPAPEATPAPAEPEAGAAPAPEAPPASEPVP